jgi:hypothetical protein
MIATLWNWIAGRRQRPQASCITGLLRCRPSRLKVERLELRAMLSLSCGDFTTVTQGGWGADANGNNPGTYRDANFSAAFPNGVQIGNQTAGAASDANTSAGNRAALFTSSAGVILNDNGNHVVDPGEKSAVTGANGVYTFGNLGPGTYTVTEATPPAGWVQTRGKNGYTVTAQSGVNVRPLNFGNEFVCNRNGKTLGFWSNTNGQSLIVQADIDALNALNLRTSAGGNADFTGTLDQEKAALKAFLQGGTATNMANMLSAQLASTVLDLRHGYFGTSQAIYVDSVLTNWAGNSQGVNLAKNLDHDGNSNNADPSGNVNQFGFAAIGDSAATSGLIKAANDELGLHPTAVAGNTWRAYQEALKIAFDGMNNNQAVFAT